MKQILSPSRAMILLIITLSASCQAFSPVVERMTQEEVECKSRGGAYILEPASMTTRCSLPPSPSPVVDDIEDEKPSVSPPSAPGDGACALLGHTTPARFRKGLEEPARQFITMPGELGGHPLARGRISAEVTGFGALAEADRDSFSLIISTVRPGSRYRIVFSADTWRHGEDMFTRWTAQHFPTGARSPRQEPMDQFEHWLYPESRYLFDCQWDESAALCRVHQIGTEWTAETRTPFLAGMGALTEPLIFGDKAHPAYQSMGPTATVLLACLSVY